MFVFCLAKARLQETPGHAQVASVHNTIGAGANRRRQQNLAQDAGKRKPFCTAQVARSLSKAGGLYAVLAKGRADEFSQQGAVVRLRRPINLLYIVVSLNRLDFDRSFFIFF